MNGFEYFDRVYCIHLPNRERRAAMTAQCARLGIAPTYLHVPPPPAGFTMSNMRRNPAREFGTALSHLRAVVQAIADGAKRPLFLEDDVEFTEPERLARTLTELPPWDVLYLGGHPREKVERVSGLLVKVGRFSFAESYALSNPLAFFEFWANRAGQPDAMIDLVLGEYAAQNRGYCIYPVLTSQPPNFSQISGKLDDKRAMVERGWRNNL